MNPALRDDILARLQKQPPYPGEKRIYQPVALCSGRDWEVLRPDSARRVAIMDKVVRAQGLVNPQRPAGEAPPSYLDLGCNTGYFCRAMMLLGFRSEGVDVVKEDIEVARMIDDYLGNAHGTYVAQDAYEYLSSTQDVSFDVTSALSSIQWLMIQKSADHGLRCIEWLFHKTRRVCFFEMGYSDEEHYRDKIGFTLDREWTRNIMTTVGRFDEVVLFEPGPNKLKRDFFVGIRRTP